MKIFEAVSQGGYQLRVFLIAAKNLEEAKQLVLESSFYKEYRELLKESINRDFVFKEVNVNIKEPKVLLNYEYIE